MIHEILATIYFFLPAGVANMTPVLLTKIFGEGAPVSERLFGAHKSWRGLIAGTAAGTLFFVLQRQPIPLAAGFLMSAGALCGDLLKSFLKRRRHLPPGATWFPFDQIDYIAGAIAATAIVVPLSLRQIAIALVAFFVLHLIISAAGWLVRLKAHPI